MDARNRRTGLRDDEAGVGVGSSAGAGCGQPGWRRLLREMGSLCALHARPGSRGGVDGGGGVVACAPGARWGAGPQPHHRSAAPHLALASSQFGVVAQLTQGFGEALLPFVLGETGGRGIPDVWVTMVFLRACTAPRTRPGAARGVPRPAEMLPLHAQARRDTPRQHPDDELPVPALAVEAGRVSTWA